MGNESCDLDSVSSAIGLAYFYQHLALAQRKEFFKNLADDVLENLHFIPVANIYRDELNFKTEVVHHLKNMNIKLTNVIV